VFRRRLAEIRNDRRICIKKIVAGHAWNKTHTLNWIWNK
jgi:hypothetical protein